MWREELIYKMTQFLTTASVRKENGKIRGSYQDYKTTKTEAEKGIKKVKKKKKPTTLKGQLKAIPDRRVKAKIPTSLKRFKKRLGKRITIRLRRAERK